MQPNQNMLDSANTSNKHFFNTNISFLFSRFSHFFTRYCFCGAILSDGSTNCDSPAVTRLI